ncbi:hypothetical protein D3C78_1646610 [compost metagenome]
MGVAAPHRETQVVANQRSYPPAFDLELHLALARRVMLMLTGHTEQVALVVKQNLAIWPRPQ